MSRVLHWCVAALGVLLAFLGILRLVTASIPPSVRLTDIGIGILLLLAGAACVHRGWRAVGLTPP